jgi:hypothetical protein
MSSEQVRMTSKARRSDEDEAGFGAIGGQFHVAVTATRTILILVKAMEVIKKRGGKGGDSVLRSEFASVETSRSMRVAQGDPCAVS